MRHLILIFSLLLFSCINILGQPQGYWHGKERKLRYTPEGEDFVIVNGDKKFNRALYGTNTAFRIETGDLPEFGFFMPNMGGNMQLGLIKDGKSLWLNDAEYIKSIYRAGSRIYEIKDVFIESGKITISVLAMANAEGLIMRVESENLPSNVDLITIFGGANNKRFFRNGDLGVDDPNAFDLQPYACLNNVFSINGNAFILEYGQGTKGGAQKTVGVYPENSEVKLASPFAMTTPLNVWKSVVFENKPIVLSKTALNSSNTYYLAIQNNKEKKLLYSELKKCFDDAETKRKSIAETVKINTPDPYFNTLGGVLSIAADGIWDPDCWQHGAVGWRMPLNGWRAAYVGDAIGWHDRARKHFDGYAASQITNIEPTISHPAQDQKLNLARADKTWGTQMYSNGYITRNQYNTSQMHHYDMNLCYIDELLWHFNWTGEMDYVRKMWPVLKSHLAWEKRNFDPNDDGLYDAYASIWASDALQYNSGSVTHSSAYNYRANKMAAQIAAQLGEDPNPYADEADKILKAINSQLWLEGKGWWAEYKDFMGNKMIHPNAAIWTVYHAIDSDIHTPFQAYQATRYIDTEIPHIPVLARGLDDEGYQTISTTNWLPYSWSINNVAFAEVAHTSLAYWQSGRNDEAFKLFKSSILDGMYLGGSPGNIGQVSFYDAARGECYRDFGDPIGVYSRTLIQGLFGILPDAMNDRLEIRPGFPSAWEYASVSTPDIDFDFKRKGNLDTYIISSKFEKSLNLDLRLKAQKENILSVKINGKPQKWSLEEAVGKPLIKIESEPSKNYIIEIEWGGSKLDEPTYIANGVKGENWTLASKSKVQKIYDPQNVLTAAKSRANSINGQLNGELGHRTLFVQLKQGQMMWWQPVSIEIKETVSIDYDAEAVSLQFTVKNNLNKDLNVQLLVNSSKKQPLTIKQGETSNLISISEEDVKFGTNSLQLVENGKIIYETNLINWNLKNQSPNYETINIDNVLNASVTQIFKNEYLTPRSPYTTLQVPKQGIGEWCHPTMTANIDDSGLRKATNGNLFMTPFGVPFRTQSELKTNNIAFTSLWDNYPNQLSAPLTGKASHAYLMMAGSTNHMQCHVVNGTVTVNYQDGTKEILELVNPETWAPIEQDFFIDRQAFRSKQPRPYRVAFKRALVSRDLETDLKISPTEVYGRTIDGGAGMILDLPLDTEKELKNIEVKAVANEVIIGLMAVTLLR
ncbi:uncharacterized protein DUF4450 [Dysgonomonas alginatilytica]|uniref:Uncharacterized protein DUF4450 n=1 Tax=Dysgonomonas alginatilytica TaxID=1605892 RepID=A0A2V3PSQ4_9BACT|nr:DUF4450 domain-containing protein [Dysgonomonas alginatilytica]PXV66257.1 uncharacterized protein DUF4450 [Dysgonomonas alginatilytica]